MAMSKHDAKDVDVKGAAPAAPDIVEEAAGSGDPVIEALAAEAREARELAARAQAEFANTRRRLEQRHADAVVRAGERMVEAIIPALDDLDFAIAHAEESGSDMCAGLNAIRTKLLNALSAEGVEVLDPVGQPHDHDTANAVQVVQDSSVPDDTVVKVLQRGYRLGGKVVRPAMVVVSRA